MSFLTERRAWERERLIQYLRDHDSAAAAAKAAGVNRTHFFKLMQRHGLKSPYLRGQATRLDRERATRRMRRGNMATYHQRAT